MGAANVIPGVSGGTIAFITGIYERLIDAIKSFDITALKMLFSGDIKGALKHVDFFFLVALFSGIGVSIISLAKVMKFLFESYEVLTMAFFFGLILASIYLVGKQVSKWGISSISFLLIGIAIAVGIAFLPPAQPNGSPLYMFVCGIVAICSMILPGLSGSYILLLMGNYVLMMQAISDLDLKIIIPMGIGCVVGLVAFSYLLSYLFKSFKDQTIAILTGFVAGSLLIIWPWKNTIMEEVIPGKFKPTGYEWLAPEMNTEFFLAIGLVVFGGVVVLGIERMGDGKPEKGE